MLFDRVLAQLSISKGIIQFYVHTSCYIPFSLPSKSIFWSTTASFCVYHLQLVLCSRACLGWHKRDTAVPQGLTPHSDQLQGVVIGMAYSYCHLLDLCCHQLGQPLWYCQHHKGLTCMAQDKRRQVTTFRKNKT